MKVYRIAVLLFLPFVSLGQDFNWPEDRLSAENANTSYRIHLENGEYRLAANELSWLLQNAPQLSVAIYQHGTKIYEELSLLEKAEELKLNYADSAMLLYDLRMKYYNDSLNVMNRKSFAAFKVYSKVSKRREQMYLIVKEGAVYCQDRFLAANMFPYMSSVNLYQKEYNSLPSEEVVQPYNQINGIYENLEDSDKQKYEKQLMLIDRLFEESMELNCNDYDKYFISHLNKWNEDQKYNTWLFTRLNEKKCKESDSYQLAAYNLNKIAPNFNLSYRILAKSALQSGNIESAESYLKQSLSLASNQEDKLAILKKLSEIELSKRNFPVAYNYAEEMQSIDPGNKDAYKIKGDIFFLSAKNCSRNEDPVYDRLCYIVAFEMYTFAGDIQMAAKAKEQFPAREEIFTMNYEIDQVIKLDCWIQVDVKVQSR